MLPRIRATDFRNCIGYIDQLFTRYLDRQTNFRYLCTWIQRTWLVGLNYNEPLLNRYLLLTLLINTESYLLESYPPLTSPLPTSFPTPATNRRYPRASFALLQPKFLLSHSRIDKSHRGVLRCLTKLVCSSNWGACEGGIPQSSLFLPPSEPVLM